MKNGEFKFSEISRNKFGRRWGIKKGNKIIHAGYNFKIGKELFYKILREEDKADITNPA